MHPGWATWWNLTTVRYHNVTTTMYFPTYKQVNPIVVPCYYGAYSVAYSFWTLIYPCDCRELNPVSAV